MSRIDDLLRLHCPKGVETRPLGEVGEVFRGRRFTKADYVDDGLAAIHYGELYTHYGTSATDVVTRVRSDLAQSLRFVKPGDVVIAEVGETVEDVGKAVAWLGNEDVAIHDGCYGFRSPLNPVFVSYYLQTAAFHIQKNPHVARAKVKRLSLGGLKQIPVPVPPAEVQAEIVRVLDSFQSLEAELAAALEAEQKARQHQFAYYRDSLMAFDAVSRTSQLVTLADLVQMKAGNFVASSDLSPIADARRAVPCYGGNGLRGYVDRPTHDGAYLVIGRQGALCGNVHRVRGRFYATEHAVVASPAASVDVDWAFHLLTVMRLNQYATKSAQPGLSVGRISHLPVPLPSISEQRRVASILDSLGAVEADISVALPAELVARRRQYEYHRDRLLTFEEAA